MQLLRLPSLLLSSFILLVFLTACENLAVQSPDTINRPGDEWQKRERREAEGDTIFGKGGLTFGGEKSERQGQGGGAGIGVNSFLWRATLDTISFMPLASADPFGGVILTDWHIAPESPNERFKLNVYILGQALRADALRVAAFKQVKAGTEWQNAALDAKAVVDIENSILTRARQLRSESAVAQ